MNCPTEHQEQVRFFLLARSYLPAHMRGLLFAIPNGGKRNIVTAMKLKREGVLAGVPDIMLAWHRLGYHGLFIEMKRKHGGTVSPEQRKMHEALRCAGYFVEVCHGADSAMRVLKWYMLSGGEELGCWK